jgi:hypothetical protein
MLFKDHEKLNSVAVGPVCHSPARSGACLEVRGCCSSVRASYCLLARFSGHMGCMGLVCTSWLTASQFKLALVSGHSNGCNAETASHSVPTCLSNKLNYPLSCADAIRAPLVVIDQVPVVTIHDMLQHQVPHHRCSLTVRDIISPRSNAQLLRYGYPSSLVVPCRNSTHGHMENDSDILVTLQHAWPTGCIRGIVGGWQG